ncbi:MFS transporter [Paraburkholderia fungorum]|uniref:MFS transporter n=1 Tax=Paraburkholderia fungorum TaxID=134537 RepID=UPI0038BBCE8F
MEEGMRATQSAAGRWEMTRVLVASTVGTLFEWYDFFLYGSLASVISTQFFSGLTGSAQFVFALLVFGVGFAFRPLGALIFGRLGDRVGRKYTFLATLILMGGATFCVGLLPSYAKWGLASPALLVLMRILQGVGIGGEYGGAAVFVAEHAPTNRRGAYTSWIQTTGPLGMVVALMVVYFCRRLTGDAFESWGWRIPFLLSGVILAISLYIRMQISESPLFQKMKAEGKTSQRPIAETFGEWRNFKVVLIALFGLVTGVTTVIYTAQVYSFFFLTHTLRVDPGPAGLYVAIALVITTPLFWVVGSLSDRVGRKPIIMLGCLVGALTFFPIYHALTHYANPALESAILSAPVTVEADSATCSLQFNPLGSRQEQSDCDRVKALLAQSGVPYRAIDESGATHVTVTIGRTRYAGAAVTAIQSGLVAAGYPVRADPAHVNAPMIVLLVVLLGVYLAMVFAPLAAALVEMFPGRIRYTALSFPYHLGNGLVGGFFPAIAFAIVAQTGDIYAGLWYPVVFTLSTVVIGGVFLKEQRAQQMTELGRSASTATERPQ